MSKIKSYFQESYHELVEKTTWPTWKELQKTAVLVAVSAVIIALLIFAMDRAISFVLGAFYDLF
ncbi:MAG: preprotein translocase subunit SecE [Schleiferiaceae bacterium]|jgi:preprotein translocase subunit SecE|nr:preprotein translocase subunit SecE [Schleiferiaceae bacterium]MDR9441337.1 preprotein translocase subunit SecE [Schleiferiaceae bacterium]